jgi:hypothetical protein
MIECPEMKLALRADERPFNSHARVYNAPSASEIDVLIPGNCDEIGQISSRDFVVHLRDESKESVRAMDVTHRYLKFGI